MYLQNGEIQCNRHERLLSAGEKRDRLELLARRLHLDLDAAAEDVAFILELEPRLAAAEELEKRLLKRLVEQPELFGEDLRHLVGQLVDHARQLAHGALDVRALLGEVGIARVHALELLDRADIRRAESLDIAGELRDAARRLRDALQLHALRLRLGMAQLIALPEPVEDLLFLHGRGVQLLLQAAHLALAGEQRVVCLAALALGRGAPGLERQLLL